MARRSDGAEGTSDMESLECTRDHDSIHRSRDEEELERKNDSKNAVSCRVCGDKASGKHYGTMTCDGCRGFFKRSVRRHLVYTCRDNNRCVVDVGRRNQCQSCRLQKCVQAGMKKDAVQHERAPRRRLTEGEELTSPPLADPERVEPAGDVPRLLPREALFSNYQCASSPRTAPLSPPLTPKPAITLESSEQLYELSVQILYTSITWARNIPTFNDLPFRDQIVVLEESWSELFLLSLAQWSLPIDMDLMLQLGGISKKDALSEEIKGAISDLARLQYIVQRFRVMDLDATEYACLKAVALFKPELQGLEARDHIEELQDQAQLTMQEHCRDRPPAARFGRLILKLPLLREISPQVIERFFFRGSLCNASSKKNHPLLFNWEYMIRESMRMMEDSERHY